MQIEIFRRGLSQARPVSARDKEVDKEVSGRLSFGASKTRGITYLMLVKGELHFRY